MRLHAATEEVRKFLHTRKFFSKTADLGLEPMNGEINLAQSWF
jgi:hypothetical protein